MGNPCLRLLGIVDRVQQLNNAAKWLGTRLVLRAWFLLGIIGWAQPIPQHVAIEVRVHQLDGPLKPAWNYFGYDEVNYTYAPNGKKLLQELAASSPVPVYVRVHNLFTTGDDSSSLKWGSTNVYTEDATGKPIYSWVIVDRIFDAFLGAGVKPLVEIGFMPEALSTHPSPYRHNFPQSPIETIYTGWTYPPKDFRRWSQLVFEFVRHLRARYGDAEIRNWLWEVWNEPDIGYWKGTTEEFFKLYDYSVDAVLRAFPQAQIGGPDSTGPTTSNAAGFLRQFLNHCANERNYVTGKLGSHLDFVSFHAKGSPTWQVDHLQMGIAHQLSAIEQGFRVVTSFPQWRQTPILLGESDPEGCAACSARQYPQNSYRNGPLYACYTVEVLNNILDLVRREHVVFRGAVTWAFEFEDQPYFAGFRDLATNGVDKPVLNAFRLLGLLGEDRLRTTSTGALAAEEIVQSGVRGRPDINAMAARKNHEIEILVWNYHDEDLPDAAPLITLTITGLPANRALLEHFRVDAKYSNAYAAWQQMGSPQSPSPAQREELETAGQLQMLNSPEWIRAEEGIATLHFTLPRHGLSLLRLSW